MRIRVMLNVFSVVFSTVLLVGLTSCGTGQRNITLDASPEEVAQVRSIAIASITARPSETLEAIPYQKGNLVRVLTKFENELFSYLLLRGYNVINPAVSRIAYSRETDYEDLYIANSPDVLTNLQSGAEFKYIANNMKKLSPGHIQKPAGAFTSQQYEPSQYNLQPSTNRTPIVNQGMVDIVSSANTRVFPQLELGTNLSTPSMTILGGADDNRWANGAMRRSVGEITRRIGADAAIIVDGHLRLSPREEGALVAGMTGGGTRYIIFEGTAMLVRNDGAILSVDSFHGFSDDHVSGDDFDANRPRTFAGLARFEGNRTNLNDLTMQAVRNAADMIAETYKNHYDTYGPTGEKGQSFLQQLFD
jgi:hypothetical protein